MKKDKVEKKAKGNGKGKKGNVKSSCSFLCSFHKFREKRHSRRAKSTTTASKEYESKSKSAAGKKAKNCWIVLLVITEKEGNKSKINRGR